MFSPSELEGEVDHTFFDSDGEDRKAEDGKKLLLTTSDISSSNKAQPKPADNITSISDDETNKDPRSENNNIKGLERKHDNKEEVHSSKSSKHLMAMLAQAKDFEEDEEGVRHSGSKDTESSSTSGHRGSRAGSATSGEAPSVTSEELDDTVTDVSPLSSTASSHLQSLDLNHSETEDDSVEQQQSAPSSDLNSTQHHENFSQEEDDYSLSSVSHLDRNVIVQFTGARLRKNYSFSNDEIRRIDHENQRLFQQLFHCSFGSIPGSASRQRHCGTSSTPLNHLSPSTLNRLREQKRIEQDNLAFLKRLQSVKPTAGMKRLDQLSDYQRQAGYLGIPVYMTTTKKYSTGKGHIQNKPPHHSARSAPTATELRTPVPRTRKPKAAPPAWS